MMIVSERVNVHLALGYTDMRKGLDGLAMPLQQTLKQDPLLGHLFALRGKKASILKILSRMETGCACSPSGSTRAASFGRRWRIMTRSR
jgi:IS66 Orf2 like protein